MPQAAPSAAERLRHTARPGAAGRAVAAAHAGAADRPAGAGAPGLAAGLAAQAGAGCGRGRRQVRAGEGRAQGRGCKAGRRGVLERCDCGSRPAGVPCSALACSNPCGGCRAQHATSLLPAPLQGVPAAPPGAGPAVCQLPSRPHLCASGRAAPPVRSGAAGVRQRCVARPGERMCCPSIFGKEPHAWLAAPDSGCAQ